MKIIRKRLNEIIKEVGDQSQISFSQSELCSILELANRYFDIIGAKPNIHEYYENMGKIIETYPPAIIK